VEQALNAYRTQRHEFEQISAEVLLTRLRQNEVVLLDVRPEIEYKAGHLPEALSLPLAELEHRLAELPPGQTIVAYCRGPYCVIADDALAVLAQAGWPVARLDTGVWEWQQAGYGSISH
jgi:rhodanese-related sulfurtransferase